jgi:hypothetical protein
MFSWHVKARCVCVVCGCVWCVCVVCVCACTCVIVFYEPVSELNLQMTYLVIAP